ncbi:unnamed protein product [Choristocarpus tenellus]
MTNELDNKGEHHPTLRIVLTPLINKSIQFKAKTIGRVLFCILTTTMAKITSKSQKCILVPKWTRAYPLRYFCSQSTHGKYLTSHLLSHSLEETPCFGQTCVQKIYMISL